MAERVRIQPQAVDVPADDPFRNDLLDRKEFIEAFSATLEGIQGPAVIAIDGPWGTGKTTFCKMLTAYLRDRGTRVVNINAWSTDYAKDPMAALASVLMEGTEGSSDEVRRKFKEAAVKLFRVVGPGAIRLATAGLFDLSAALEKEVSSALADVVEDRIQRFEEDTHSMEDFRNSLRDLAADTFDDPMVVIVDELDRCRPSYAVEMLEVIKHLFDVENVLFVLAVNRNQLDESVKILYGTAADPETYFRRFFDVELTLPQGDRQQFVRETLEALSLANQDAAADMLATFLGASPHSVRAIIQAIHHYALVRSSFPLGEGSRAAWSVLVATAIVLRVVDVDTYRAFIRGEMSDEEVAERFFALSWVGERRKTDSAQIFEAVLMVAAEGDEGSGYSRILRVSTATDARPLDVFQRLVDQYRTLRRWTQTSPRPWENVTKRIEMLVSNIQTWA